MSAFTPSRLALAGLISLLLAGCAIGPDYTKPKMDIPATYKEDGRWKTATPQDAARVATGGRCIRTRSSIA
jgi:starvation-inducible outer membrane lipoprotein